MDVPTDFVMDARAIPYRDDGKVACKITSPSGSLTENFITSLGDGVYKIMYTPFEEGNGIFIEICDINIPKYIHCILHRTSYY